MGNAKHKSIDNGVVSGISAQGGNSQDGLISPHSMVYEARAHLQGVEALAMQAEHELEGLTGWQLSQMLAPVSQRLTRALDLMEEDTGSGEAEATG